MRVCTLKILWASNAPWANTGYGNQTRLFVPRIQALGHEMALCAWYGLEGGSLRWNGLPVYPKGYNAYGNDVVGAHATHFGADILITLIDAWVLEPRAFSTTRWCPWFPVDMQPVPPPVLAKASQAYQPIVYSRFAEREARRAGLDVRYVPHGVDTQLMRPGDRADARVKLKWPGDKFIVGMVAANKGTPSRKALPQSVEAFARLHKAHPDTVLYLHTAKSEAGENGGVNLPELCAFLGLTVGTDVLFADAYAQLLGLPDEYMTTVYNGLDVLLACSMGEGFGIPILEAQACGTPVIVGDWTAMSELLFTGWKVPASECDPWWTPLASYQFTPRVGALVDALEEAYRNPKRGLHEGVLDYDADRVTRKYWRPLLADIERGLKHD